VGLFPGLFGLFLLGIVLSYAFIRTGSLYLSIGLHAGWVFGIKTIKVYGNYTREGLGWLFGSTDPKFLSGVATWVGFLMVGLIVYWLTRKRQRGESKIEDRE
jgi:membrane protease YdiL (CAAX protease family)